ncbi:cell wall-binding repeat-containing protein [Ornithinimicrobium cryptoxanthini]|uniref:Cell wall-binding repeat-containing protein n=1 Tax=Ornithinimicrobium cryptoxanthini TaxID=2934161 RepID=A0ABY4YKR2_9MICO|nr:cell wall-binding repeat-containing protein [Ornithinimicrobium cryptoxanthini]USQ77398.1 cell wall-binding repeat-containing protein [Ornithinimicrobium cryptoxanthini]
MSHRSGSVRRLLAGLAGASLVLGGALSAQGGAAGPPPTAAGLAPDERVDAAVTAELERDGTADFWVYFPERPDLSPAAAIEDWEARGQWVYDRLTSTAASSQAEVRAELDASGADYQSFHVTNAIRVTDGDAELVASLAADTDVQRLYPTFAVAPPEAGLDAVGTPAPQAIEWGIADINADDVWASGTTGEGIVVASIDSGVQWDHPALVNQYRGSTGASVDHNYNWFNAGHGDPSAPHDPDGHGTHVTGTMVGDDGGGNQIGVAPGARWVAANGCCPNDAALIASGEWTLAPTNLAGTAARPDLRPHIINNSWGSTNPSNSPFMEDISLAWAASGQFAVFANGNSGPSCNTSSSPGSRTINYSVGNYTQSHTIATTSSRGVGQDGAIKPDISAPGTSVRSAYPGDLYVSGSGTSMASPHVAGAVALLWSADPAMVGDVTGTRALLDGTAVDTANSQCGGTSGNNNAFGEGRLDALALIGSGPDVIRLAGADRYATAAAISQAAHPAGAGTVFLATGQDYPDALVGAALAGSEGAPVLLTRLGSLPVTTQSELSRLAPDQVFLFGGTAAISQAVLDEVGALTGATVTRLSGSNRYATAAMIAEEFLSASVVYVATGENFPDALAGAARAGALDGPVLLTRPGSLPAETRSQLARLAPEHIYALGGAATISQTVLDELATYGPTTRISGADRYATAVELSHDYAPPTNVFLATGLDWPDALAGAAMAGHEQNPVLLTQQGSVPGVTWTELDRLDPATVVILGGTSAVSTAVQDELRLLRP